MKAMYAEYGHSIDGIEYATVDEAEEAKRTSEDIVATDESEETE